MRRRVCKLDTIITTEQYNTYLNKSPIMHATTARCPSAVGLRIQVAAAMVVMAGVGGVSIRLIIVSGGRQKVAACCSANE